MALQMDNQLVNDIIFCLLLLSEYSTDCEQPGHGTLTACELMMAVAAPKCPGWMMLTATPKRFISALSTSLNVCTPCLVMQ